MPAAPRSAAASISKPGCASDEARAVFFWRVLLGLLPGSLKAAPSLEYAVKAAYLPKFIPFITWPDGAFAGADAPFTICLLGQDRFGGKLDQAAAGLRAGEHAVQVRHLAAPDPSANCQLIFLPAGSDPASAQGTLDAMRGSPVVTVTDSGLPVAWHDQLCDRGQSCPLRH